MIENMTKFIFQLSLIIIAAIGTGILFRKIKLPAVLGEIIAGVVIGPYVLGKIHLPGFPEGLFPYNHAMNFPVSAELYSFATVASIILLFFSGLETDIKLFLHYSLSASVIGIAGAVFSFLLGSYCSVIFLHEPYFSFKSLLLGCISMATSVGITVRILSERRKIDTPEGITILSAAVIDDVLGIITLSVILAFASTNSAGKFSNVNFYKIFTFTLKIVATWLIFTVLTLLAAKKIGKALKVFKNRMTFSLLSLSLALLMGGVFEKSGLAMIVGAYVMGLSLSRTDISYVIKESLGSLEAFFVPVFFTVMGMLLNPAIFLQKEIVAFGIIFTGTAIISKVIGCGLPAYFMNFNLRGAIRIGLGMIPRGEVALIIAGFALMYSIFDEKTFGVCVMMAMLSTLIAPPFIDASFRSSKKGVKKEPKTVEEAEAVFDIPNPELSALILSNVLNNFSMEGFFITHIKSEENLHYIRRNNIFLKLTVFNDKMIFKARQEDIGLINTIIYESFLKLFDTSQHLKSLAKPVQMKKEIVTNGGSKFEIDLAKYIEPSCVSIPLKSSEKEGVINELVEVLSKKGKIEDKETVVKLILDREKTMSTGLQNGLAVPHVRTSQVKKVEIAIGISKNGVKFGSIDELPSKIVFLILSPEDKSPHLEILASLGSLFRDKDYADKIAGSSTPEEVIELLKHKRLVLPRKTIFPL